MQEVFFFYIFLDDGFTVGAKSECMTTPESPLNPNSPCILPFKIYGQLQHECLVDVTTGRHWCPTKVDENGEYNFGEGNKFNE